MRFPFHFKKLCSPSCYVTIKSSVQRDTCRATLSAQLPWLPGNGEGHEDYMRTDGCRVMEDGHVGAVVRTIYPMSLPSTI